MTHQNVYASITDFRNESGLTQAEIDDESVELFIVEAQKKLREDAYVFVREEILSPVQIPNGSIRYYAQLTSSPGGVITLYNSSMVAQAQNRKIYFTDWNLDNTITKDDFQVFEFDSFDEVDITTQIDTIDTRRGFITLKTGYPTANRTVKMNYAFIQKPFDEVSEFLKRACTAYAQYLAFKRIRLNNTKSGITAYSIGEVNINKNFQSFDEMAEVMMSKYWHYIWIIKPFHSRAFCPGRMEDAGMQGRFRGYY